MALVDEGGVGGGVARLELGLIVNAAVSVLVFKHHLVVVAIRASRRRLPLHLLLLVALAYALHRVSGHCERLPTGSLVLTHFHLLQKVKLLLRLVVAHLVEDVLICGGALEL